MAMKKRGSKVYKLYMRYSQFITGLALQDRVSNKKKTSSVYDCTVEDVEYVCNSNSTM
jgi:hypothetical protein